jgi:hypothetical protein
LIENFVTVGHKVKGGAMAKAKKRKNQSLYEEVMELERNLPIERQKLVDMDEAAAKAHDVQAEKINTMEQRLYKGRDTLTQNFLQENMGESGIKAVYEAFGQQIPVLEEGSTNEDELCDGSSQSSTEKAGDEE